MSAIFELLVAAKDSDADLHVLDLESLDELEEELEGFIATPRRVTLDLRPMGRVAFTVPEAMRVIVQVLADRPGAVRCLFGSTKAVASAERFLPGGARAPRTVQVGRFDVRVVVGDITRVRAHAIVNASNVRLVLGAGVSGAIRQVAERPDALQAAMLALAPIQPGQVVSTPSFGLPMTNTILHAATASGGVDAIESAFREVLRQADALGLTSLAVPALGTGTGGLPAARCAELFAEALAGRQGRQGSLRRIDVVLFDGAMADTFAEALGAE
jgi:O-acetyl-ADP-ribose deacetylase (regulator of RNase III)